MTTSNTMRAKTTTEIEKLCPDVHRHTSQIRIIELQAEVDCERLRLQCSDIHYIERLRQRKSALVSLDDALKNIRLDTQRKVIRINQDFKLRWFLWRFSLPISVATNTRSVDILFGPRTKELVISRRLCLWLTWNCGGFPYFQIGNILGRDHTTVRHSVIFVQNALETPDSPFHSLLDDVLKIEDDGELQRIATSHIRRTNRR